MILTLTMNDGSFIQCWQLDDAKIVKLVYEHPSKVSSFEFIDNQIRDALPVCNPPDQDWDK